jgi:diaminohydroxyphosphoribosylaminopyrimidine deaminase / 5-amino-6-(5-phosphoribosylamino)uracil reductase
MTADSWMIRALELAERGRGQVEPNPLVGAVVVRDGAMVGEGWHERYGGPHAEVNALAAASDTARGATLYVTLEPCCHHGKSPPCTDAIQRAGIKRVVAATLDPFPQVAGQGVAVLRAAGIEVDVGEGETEARELNRPYLTLIDLGRPYVHAKWAMSLDGKIATRTGNSKWISGEAARRRVHKLRGRMDAIVVGAGTVRADDPLLTARPAGPRLPARIVLLGSDPLPVGSYLEKTAGEAPVILVKTAGQGTRVDFAEVLEMPAENGMPSVAALLQELGRRRMTNVMVEGGAAVLGSFHDAELIDELHVFVAPNLIGGAKAFGAVGGLGLEQVGGGRSSRVSRWEQLGDDLYINARFPLRHQPA